MSVLMAYDLPGTRERLRPDLIPGRPLLWVEYFRWHHLGREFMGIERMTFVIDKSGVVRHVFPKVKVDGHTDEVIEALKALA